MRLVGSGDDAYLDLYKGDSDNTVKVRLHTTSHSYFLGGNVGIGTASPGATLDVRGSAIFNEDGAAVDFRVEGAADANLLFLDASMDRVGIGTAMPRTKLDVNGGCSIENSLRVNSAEGGYEFRAYGSGDASLLVTDAANDRVGIGTQMPSEKLEVVGNVKATKFIENERAFFFTYRTAAKDLPANNTWYDVEWNTAAAPVKIKVTHNHASNPEQITLTVAGLYRIQYSVIEMGAGTVMCRLLKDGTEIVGSYIQSGHNGSDHSTITHDVLVYAAASAVIELQAGTNVAGMDISYFNDANCPDPTTLVSATITIERLSPDTSNP
jgi:hypothetical protein